MESYLQSLQRIYANTHTEDDITGRSMTQLLHEAGVANARGLSAAEVLQQAPVLEKADLFERFVDKRSRTAE